jgi:hypothetical protein
MFAKSQTDSALDREIAAALKELGETRDNPEKYNATLDRIARLEKLKTKNMVSLFFWKNPRGVILGKSFRYWFACFSVSTLRIFFMVSNEPLPKE